MKKIKILFAILALIVTYTCKSQQAQTNINTEIIGTWIAEEDSKVKLTFNTNNTCLDYYDSILSDTFDYVISHKCEENQDLNAWFLKMVDQEDFSVRCYEIYGANLDGSNKLVIRDMKTGKIFVYNKV